MKKPGYPGFFIGCLVCGLRFDWRVDVTDSVLSSISLGLPGVARQRTSPRRKNCINNKSLDKPGIKKAAKSGFPQNIQATTYPTIRKE
ncbi:hypothetical protein [Herminiimonas sp. KBW02]|uniref:hypothetical protein n=1 Tax=Herminiimonas sp. KBW02 TaxID=2153363 RepID=UPI000F598CEE|nr:hypothetical protein [Herminiimonas sp. KBW02]